MRRYLEVWVESSEGARISEVVSIPIDGIDNADARCTPILRAKCVTEQDNGYVKLVPWGAAL